MRRSTDELLARLLSGLERELPHAIALRQRLHAQPELAHAEEHTAATVARELPVACMNADGTGRIARVGPDAGPAVAIRAELDAADAAVRRCHAGDNFLDHRAQREAILRTVRAHGRSRARV